MTREIAINRIREIERCTPIHTEDDVKDCKALEMAIQALSQEPTDDATLKDIFCMGCEYKEQEPCTDAVSREAVYSILKEYHIDEEEIESAMDDCQNLTVNGIASDVSLLPSVTQKSGKWEDLHRCWVCSECGKQTYIEHKYCPNCGARMESEDKTE